MAKSTLPAISVDSEQVLRRFNGLMEVAEGKRARKDMKSAFRSTLSILRSAARKGAATVVGSKTNLAKKGVLLKVSRNGLGGRVMITHADYYPEYGPGKSGQGKVLGLFWWELGTQRGRGRDGRMHGATPAKPFFKAAIESRIGEASDRLIQSLDKIIQKEATR